MATVHVTYPTRHHHSFSLLPVFQSEANRTKGLIYMKDAKIHNRSTMNRAVVRQEPEPQGGLANGTSVSHSHSLVSFFSDCDSNTEYEWVLERGFIVSIED